MITSSQILTDELRPLLTRLRKKPVILCIGSDRVTGDSLGPLVGLLLTGLNVGAYVYGTLSSPVTALNLNNTIAFIKDRHPGCKIVAIDSSVGTESEVGLVHAFRGGIRPGAADGKSLPLVGDVSVTATVAASTHKNLYSVRLGFVYSLALTVAKSISELLPRANLLAAPEPLFLNNSSLSV